MRTRWIALALLGAVAVGAVVVGLVEAPVLAKRKLIAAVRDNCDGCEFDVDALELHPASGEIVAHGIRFHSNPNDFVEVSFEFEQIEGHVAIRPLLHGTWEFRQIAAAKPVFQVIEKDPKPHTTPTPETFPRSLPPLTIAAMSVSDGAFTYTHRVKGQDAIIHVSHVKGTAANFSSRPGLGSSKTTFDVSSQLERSGKDRIRADFDLLADKSDDHLEVDVNSLPLREMDAYFVKSDGVHVDGMLQNATATMAIRNSMLTGNLAARYRDLVVHYSKTQDRGAISSFFAETLGKILTRKTQGQQEEPASAHFKVARTPDESIIKFLLSGLKPAAHDILTGHTAESQEIKYGK